MNSVVLIGRLTRDPELRYTAGTQMAVATFTLAIDRPVRAGGERQTDFPRVTVFGKQAENCERYLDKGRQVAVQGRIQTGSYKTQTGETRYTTEVVLGAFRGELVMLDGRADGASSSLSSDAGTSSSGWDATSLSGGADSFDDEIPF